MKPNNQNRQNNKNQDRKEKIYYDYNIFPGKVRLVGENEKVEIIERDDAIDRAKEQGLSLVQIAYNKNDFPKAICKIMDYGRYIYEQKKKEKNAAKQARAARIDVHEIVFSIRIDDGDFTTKVNHIKQFLADGDKVKITIKLLRREMRNAGIAKDTIKRVLGEIDGLAVLDSVPIGVGNILSCVVRPIKNR